VKTILLLSIWLGVGGLVWGAEVVETNLEVSIAIPQQGDQRVLDYSARNPHFHVLVTNTSDRPQRIYQEWCSWGYYALWFELSDAKGNTWTARKTETVWFKNWPAVWTIPAHECLVLDVQFADRNLWKGFPEAGWPSQTFTMRAVFQIFPDHYSRPGAVWSGRIVSKADKYVFRR
jgi:hypothetical protein